MKIVKTAFLIAFMAMMTKPLTAQELQPQPLVILPTAAEIEQMSLEEQLQALQDMLGQLVAWQATLEQPEEGTLKMGADTWTVVNTPIASDGSRLVAQSMESTSTNWLRLRIFVPVFEQGSQPTFFLEVTSGQPNTAFEILTASRLVGGLWISVSHDQPLTTGPNKITQFQAFRLNSGAQFYKAVTANGS